MFIVGTNDAAQSSFLAAFWPHDVCLAPRGPFIDESRQHAGKAIQYPLISHLAHFVICCLHILFDFNHVLHDNFMKSRN